MPFLLTAVVMYFNVELVLIPTFVAMGIRGWELFFKSEFLGNLELAYYLWFFWWFGKLIKDNPALQEFYDDAMAPGADRLFRKLVKILAELVILGGDNKEIEKANGKDRWQSFWTMYMLGLGIGTWLLGLFIFYATRSQFGLAGLFVGNITKIACFVLLANVLGLWFFVPVSILALYKAYRYVWPMMKLKLAEFAFKSR